MNRFCLTCECAQADGSVCWQCGSRALSSVKPIPPWPKTFQGQQVHTHIKDKLVVSSLRELVTG